MIPMPPLLLRAAPYILAGAAGFGAAWYVRGLAVTAAEQELTAAVQASQAAAIQAAQAADTRRQEADRDWQSKLQRIKSDGDAYRRCVAAGKCGGVLQYAGDCPARAEVPPAGSADGAGTDTVPAPRGPAPEVIAECAITTGMLNALQQDIERQ